MTLVIVTLNGTEYEGELIYMDGVMVEICYEHEGIEHYGRCAAAALKIHGQRMSPWYDLDGADVTWTVTKDLDNLETWE